MYVLMCFYVFCFFKIWFLCLLGGFVTFEASDSPSPVGADREILSKKVAETGSCECLVFLFGSKGKRWFCLG